MNKLYYQDPYIKSFSAKLLLQKVDEFGKPYVILDKTAFYPTGGGQPHDTGTINDVKVINVEEIDGEIRHYVEQPLSDEVSEITGIINWERRFDHMQQHAGQHILSAAFEELFDINTVSFHLGTDIVTIDLDIEELNFETAAKVEQRANQIILENRPIETKWVREAELSQYPMRKKPSVTDNIRLVIIPDFDYNGCGGTHPSTTGQIRGIKLLEWERQRKKIRLTFICGDRLLQELQQKHQILKELSPLLSAPENELGNAAKRLLDQCKKLEKSLDEAKDALLFYEGKDLINTNYTHKETKIVSHIFKDRTIKELQKLARIIISEANDTITFIVAINGPQLQLVCAKGTAAKGNMKNLISEILPLINGKGGGNESFAQGGGEALLTGEQTIQLLLEKL